jgi:hypothetical protein
MSVVDSNPTSVQAGAFELRRRTNLRQSLRAMRENASTAYAPEDFSADVIKQRILWSRIFVINQPEGIRHVLLDNAANYTKSEVGRRVLPDYASALAYYRSPEYQANKKIRDGH